MMIYCCICSAVNTPVDNVRAIRQHAASWLDSVLVANIKSSNLSFFVYIPSLYLYYTLS